MDKKVKTYTTSTCPYCIRLKTFLNDKKIPFENFDVGADKAKAQEMKQISGQMGVPVICIDDKIIVGFDKDEICNELGIK